MASLGPEVFHRQGSPPRVMFSFENTMPTYSDRQVELLRNALIHFLEEEGSGRQLPVSALLDNMVRVLCIDDMWEEKDNGREAPGGGGPLYDEDQVRQISNNAMRKFINGESQKIGHERLEMLEMFLIREDKLTVGWSIEDPMEREIAMVRSYFGNTDDAALHAIARLGPTYVDRTDSPFKTAVTPFNTETLTIDVDVSGEFFRCNWISEETTSRNLTARSLNGRRRDRRSRAALRRGYGFVSTEKNTVVMYLRDPDQRKQHFAMQVLDLLYPEKSHADLQIVSTIEYDVLYTRPQNGKPTLKSVFEFVAPEPIASRDHEEHDHGTA